MLTYDIEDIDVDHPALLTWIFQACAIARCKEVSASPYSLDIDCQDLPTTGTKSEICDVAWQKASEASAEKAKKTSQSNPLTEDAAVGLCAVAFAVLREGEITDVTAHGSGVDYWLDDLRAVLEISGIQKGNAGALGRRHARKEKQLRNGSLFQAGNPGYVFVVDFGRKKSILSYHT